MYLVLRSQFPNMHYLVKKKTGVFGEMVIPELVLSKYSVSLDYPAEPENNEVLKK